MAPQGHQTDKNYLVKVGKEGFALVDEFFGRPKKSGWLPNPQSHDHHRYKNEYRYQQPYIYKGTQVIIVKEPVIDCYKAAELYDGKVIVDHRIGKPIRVDH